MHRLFTPIYLCVFVFSSITTANMMWSHYDLCMHVPMVMVMVMSMMPCAYVHEYASIIMMMMINATFRWDGFLSLHFVSFVDHQHMKMHKYVLFIHESLLCHDSSSVFTLMMHTRQMPFESIYITPSLKPRRMRLSKRTRRIE